MIFETRIKGIPCQVEVTNYVNRPAVTHLAPEDCYPAEFEFEYNVLDRKGYPADWLQEKVDRYTEDDLIEEFQRLLSADYFD